MNSSPLQVSRVPEPKNFAVVAGGKAVHRKTGLANERNVFQRRIRFYLLKRHRLAKRFDRGKIDCAPIAFFRSRVGISGMNNFRAPNYGFGGCAPGVCAGGLPDGGAPGFAAAPCSPPGKLASAGMA